MFIVAIMAAPIPKKIVLYDPIGDDLLVLTSDIIGLVDLTDGDEEPMTAPMYLCADPMGIYYAPQMDITFLDIIEKTDIVDLGKYIIAIEEIKRHMNEVQSEVVEVETTGNLSKIKRYPVKKKQKPEEPRDEH